MNTQVSPDKLRTYPNDPMQVQEYTLENGLKLFMSVLKNQPRVFGHIAVRTGAKNDPPETTGLAHYMEHMMFKGSDRMATLNWKEEKKLLDQIEALFEKHRNEADAEKRLEIYREIDRLSHEASKFVSANEYDRLISQLGARHVNAYTWKDQTVYYSEVPSNELERWMKVESERFRKLVLRLFHTELETVYEEFNMIQVRDNFKVYSETSKALFAPHPYGTHDTIGLGEHLKQPSQTNIYRFFEKYYVPNNMAIVLVGDFEPEKAIALTEKYFGKLKPNPGLEQEEARPEPAPLTEDKRITLYGAEAAFMEMAWRFGPAKEREAYLLQLIDVILQNGQAGIFDIELLQPQKLLGAYSYPVLMAEYSHFQVGGRPREGQSLEEVEQLLLEALQKLAKGDFPDWLVQAAANELILRRMKQLETNQGRSEILVDAYILGIPYEQEMRLPELLRSMDKKEVMAFAKRMLKQAKVVIYKEMGEDPNILRVEQPPITPVHLNRNDFSDFGKEVLQMPVEELKPEFTDFSKRLKESKLREDLPFTYIHNKTNQIFDLYYVFDRGKWHNPMLAPALNFLRWAGTDRYNSSQIEQEFYRLGLEYKYSLNSLRSHLRINGLAESLPEGAELFEHFLRKLKADPQALANMAEDIIKMRENAKTKKEFLLRNGMKQFAKYGYDSPLNWNYTNERLRQLQADEIEQAIHSLFDYPHEVMYYGPQGEQEAMQIVREKHQLPGRFKPVEKARQFVQLDRPGNEVFFLHYPSVQTEILLISKRNPGFDPDDSIMSMWYNNYFGYGLSSIVFQEIRESKGLAYSTFAKYTTPPERNNAHYLEAFVGTQPDKMQLAVDTLVHITDNMPVLPEQMEQARLGVLKKIASSRLNRDWPYWKKREYKRLGLPENFSEISYERLSRATSEDLVEFHQKRIKNARYTYLVLGDKDQVNWEYMRSIGPVTELDVDELLRPSIT
ncbi:MAG TPA: insulinase family protein [Phaeodactylibacter sp.]|nr:insulinase family protein [Phaeodactylibacter sp.]